MAAGGQDDTVCGAPASAHAFDLRPVAERSPAACAKLDEMQTRSGDFELTMDELRAVAGYAVACAEPALALFQKARPDDPRPAAALQAARGFAEGAPRSRLQRTSAADAHRAARDATPEAARHAASAAGAAAAAAYLHPLATATQVRHILGSAAHAARAAELARGDDPVVAEYAITAAAKRTTPVVLDVLTRYPRAPRGAAGWRSSSNGSTACFGIQLRRRAWSTTQGRSFTGPRPTCVQATCSHLAGARTTVRGVRPNTSI